MEADIKDARDTNNTLAVTLEVRKQRETLPSRIKMENYVGHSHTTISCTV